MPLGDSGISPSLGASDPARELQTSIRKGASFSGNEPHVLLKNQNGKAFTDVSGVTGLDSFDDGRAVCLTDWDSDGDLDIWVSNRNGPQVRYFQNNNPSGGLGLNIKLIGKTCNQDAIGARATLKTKGQLPQSRTVNAGTGFLAQSSKTLHFGLAQGDQIEELSIQWPGASTQTISDIGPGNYQIEQGSKPTQVKVETIPNLSATSKPEELSDRTFLYQRLPVGTIFNRSEHTETKPLLVCLTIEGCLHCAAQIKEWHDSPPTEFHLQVINQTKLTQSDPEQFSLIQLTHDYFFDVSERNTPTPISFLIDTGNRLCAIYRGRIRAETILQDCKNLHVQGPILRAASVPFSGIWASKSIPIDRPLNYVEDLLDAGHLEAATKYISHHKVELKEDELFPMLLKRIEVLRSN